MAALACILQYKHKHINPYAKPLQKIVEERSDFKDTLLKFSLDTSAGIVQEEHRRGVVDFLGRVLMGKMMVRQRRGKGHTNPKARRRLILRFFSMGPKEELSTFLHMLIEPFSTSVDMDTLPNAAAVTPLKKQLGFLNLVTDILGNMGSGGAEDMYELALRIVLRMVYDADHLLRSRHDVLPAHVGVLKSIRLIGTKRVCDLLLARPRSYKLGSLQPALDRMVLARPLAALHTESTQTPSAFLNLVLACSGDASLHSVLQGCGDTILPRVFELLSVAKTTESVLTVVLTIAENLLRSSDEKDADATLADLSSQVRYTVCYTSFGLCHKADVTVSQAAAHSQWSIQIVALCVACCDEIDEESFCLQTLLKVLIAQYKSCYQCIPCAKSSPICLEIFRVLRRNRSM